jgi:hypothetical protein
MRRISKISRLWRSTLTNEFSGVRQRLGKARGYRTSLPFLEVLEDRTVPSAILPGFNSTTFAPNDDGTYPGAQPLGFTINLYFPGFS